MKTKFIKASISHSAVITTDGQLYTWGQGDSGQLGHGRKKTIFKPKLVKFFEEMEVFSADLAKSFSIVIAKDFDGSKKVFGFGENKNSRLSDKILSDEVPIPTEIEFFSRIRPD